MSEATGAQPWVPEGARTIAALREAAQGCQGCELHGPATQAVMGEGDVDAPLLLLGEQPGDKEDLEGHPFVGPAGRLLAAALEEAGIDVASTYRTNAVKHFRYRIKGKRRIHEGPTRTHVVACRPWLVAELALVRPSGVVLLGATAGQAVLGPSFRVTQQRGTVVDWPGDIALGHQPEWVLPTVHPSSVLRSRERDRDRAAFVADLRAAAERMATW